MSRNATKIAEKGNLPCRPEDLLARARWFMDVVRALGEGGPKSHVAREGPSDVLAELRFQARLLSAIRELDPPAQSAIVERFFTGRSRGFRFDLGRARRERSVRTALMELREHLDRAFGSRSNWVAELPAWALAAPARESGATDELLLLPDTASRILVGFVLVLVATFCVWVVNPTWAAAKPQQVRSAPMLALVPHDREPCRIEGHLELEGLSVESWSVALGHQGREDADLSSGRVGPDGSFLLETSASGTFMLRFRDLPGEFASHRLEIPVVLKSGRHELDVRIPTKTVQLEAPTKEHYDLLHVSRGQGNRTFWTRFHAEKLAQLTSLDVPDGEGTWRLLEKSEPWPRTFDEVVDLPEGGVTISNDS